MVANSNKTELYFLHTYYKKQFMNIWLFHIFKQETKNNQKQGSVRNLSVVLNFSEPLAQMFSSRNSGLKKYWSLRNPSLDIKSLIATIQSLTILNLITMEGKIYLHGIDEYGKFLLYFLQFLPIKCSVLYFYNF